MTITPSQPRRIALAATLVLLVPAALHAQRPRQAQQQPHIGYLYPAGARQGAALQVTVGGQYLEGASAVHVSGQGVRITLGKYHRPLNPGEVNRLRDKIEEARKQMEGNKPEGSPPGGFGGFMAFKRIAKAAGLTDEQMEEMADFRRRMNDPKRQLNPAIAETIVLHVTLAADAPPGERELRLITPSGLSNPMTFCIDTLPEQLEMEPNDKTMANAIRPGLPVILNGQIMPGDVDRFTFEARKGMRLVAAASARELIPYLADAVPGWFQAVLTLYDSQGEQVALADGSGPQRDPLLSCEIPQDGTYVLEVKDAIFRGREDFVYRIAVGALPMVTSVFPLGARQGEPIAVQLTGWNLPIQSLTLPPQIREPGIRPVSLQLGQRVPHPVLFAVDTLPECREEEPNNDPGHAQAIALPAIVNGRIDQPDDWDVFRVEGQAGQQIVAEVWARRLNSPVDSVLRLTGASGRQLAINDDYEDQGSGLTTHQADSRICVTLPANGACYLHLGDAQQMGGPEYAYRLRISPPQPDFELRVVPASLSAKAGTSVPITVYALRKGGFSEEIALSLKAPLQNQRGPSGRSGSAWPKRGPEVRSDSVSQGFSLSGARVPAGQDRVRLTVSVPVNAPSEPLALRLEGRAVVQGREIRHTAMPAEDMMQAFFYHHLVPAKDWLVAVSGGFYRPTVRLLDPRPLKFRPGETAEVRFSVPPLPPEIKIHLQLSEPPEGMTIQETRTTRDGATVVLRADAEKIQPGLKGNLILEAVAERTAGTGDAKPPANRMQFKVGTLPAVPFEIVGR